MGQGIMGYNTVGEPVPRYSENTSWTVDGNNILKFNDAGFYACPSYDGSFSLWADVGDSTPAYQEGCRRVALRVFTEDYPVSCYYSE